MVIKKIPKQTYKTIIGIAILKFEIPTALIIIFSEPLIRLRNVTIDAVNTVKGNVKYIRLKKLYKVS
tara:strand:+ start:1450 stop:1650 length:201 start_codon:yes stop_codon:yes gene_type:complete